MKRYVLLMLITSLLLTGCTPKYDVYEIPEGANVNSKEVKYDVFGEELYLYDLFETNMEVLTENKKLDANEIGKRKETIDLKFEDRTYKADIEYEVVDVTPPSFIQAGSSKSTLLTEVLDPCSSIVFGDDYDAHPTCRIEGNVDYTNLGKYSVEYVLSDASGNETRKNLTINVLESWPQSGGSSSNQIEYDYWNDIYNKHKNDDTMIGIDVSRWQGNVDWQAVKDAGVEFVIMRIGVQTDPEETLDVDSKFHLYFDECKRLGLKVGVYVYNTALNYKDGEKVAKFVIDELNGEMLDMPVAYDWENWSKFMNYGISLHSLTDGYKAFEKTLKDAGYEAMLYSSKSYLESSWLDEEKTNVWLAHYTSKTNYEGNYMMWQMTQYGKVNGITDNTVDIDIYYKNKKRS